VQHDSTFLRNLSAQKQVPLNEITFRCLSYWFWDTSGFGIHQVSVNKRALKIQTWKKMVLKHLIRCVCIYWNYINVTKGAHTCTTLASESGWARVPMSQIRLCVECHEPESTHACVVKYIRAWLMSQAPWGGLVSQTRMCMGTLTHSELGEGQKRMTANNKMVKKVLI
jgi:hypothetical protein